MSASICRGEAAPPPERGTSGCPTLTPMSQVLRAGFGQPDFVKVLSRYYPGCVKILHFISASRQPIVPRHNATKAAGL